MTGDHRAARRVDFDLDTFAFSFQHGHSRIGATARRVCPGCIKSAKLGEATPIRSACILIPAGRVLEPLLTDQIQRRGMDKDICLLSLTELATQLRERKLSSVEVTRRILDRIRAANPF